MLGIIGWVPMSIMDDELAEIERRNAFEAGSVDPELVGVRAPLVMRVDAADRTEMVFRGIRVEAIRREIVFTLQDPDSAGVEVSATAPRILQIEQSQRLADAKPSVSVTTNCTAPQWQAPLSVTGSRDV